MKTRTFFTVIILGIVFNVAPIIMGRQTKPAPKAEKPEVKVLSEVSKLKAENFKLKIQLVQLQIAQEQSQLTATFTKELGCEATFNWESLTCKE